MIEPSQNLQNVFEFSVNVAKQLKHEYITIEHLAFGIMCDKESFKLIESVDGDANFIKTNLEHYLKNNLNEIKSEEVVKPKKTHSVERVLNRSFSQVLFSGRQKIEIYDIIVSILSEKNSFAFYFLNKGGVNKEKFVRHVHDNIINEEEEHDHQHR